MSEQTSSEQACPVCHKHTLAVDEPPRIDVMGIQTYSDMLGMGDLTQGGAVGIVCLSCDTRWRDKAAFDRNEPEPAVEEGDEPDVDFGDEDDIDGDGGGGE